MPKYTNTRSLTLRFTPIISLDNDTMGCRGMGEEEVGVKCGCMQGCCECAMPGVRSWRRMVQVPVITQTNRFGTAAHQW